MYISLASQTTPSIPPGGSGWLGMHCSITHGQIIERAQKHLFHQAQQVPLPFASPSVLFQVSLQSEIVPSYHNDSCVISDSVRISIWNNIAPVWRLTTSGSPGFGWTRMSNVCPVTQTHLEVRRAWSGYVRLVPNLSVSLYSSVLKEGILVITLNSVQTFSRCTRYPTSPVSLHYPIDIRVVIGAAAVEENATIVPEDHP